MNILYPQPILDGFARWIECNKPSESTSKSVADEFIQRSQIKGSDEFRNQVIKVTKKTSQTAVGIEVLKRVLENEQDIVIHEGDENRYNCGHIYLTFGKERILGESCNDQREWLFFKKPKISTLVHELLHKWNAESNPEETELRNRSKDTNYDYMDDQEEDLVITGYDAIRKTYTCCCENALLIELQKPCRVTHGGYSLSKQGSIPDIEFPALRFAVETGKASTICSLLTALDSQELKKAAVRKANDQGLTCLHIAASGESAEAIHSLLDVFTTEEEKKVILNTTDPWGNTPLRLAAISGSAKVIKALLEAVGSLEEQRAEVEKADKYNRTLLHEVAEHGDADAVNAFLTVLPQETRKIAIEKVDDCGRSPLLLAELRKYGPKPFAGAFEALLAAKDAGPVH